MRKKRKRKMLNITFDQADEIRRLVDGGASLTAICSKYGISKPYASLISRNLRKRRPNASRAQEGSA